MPLVSKSVWLGCALVFLAARADAAPLASLPNLRAVLAGQEVPAGHLGLFIGPAAGGAASVSWNADTPFNPASTIKLLPSLAVLETFTAAHRWRTRVYRAGAIQGGVLQGDLHIQGGGDPYLTMESLWAMLKAVRGAGIETVAGDIVIDDAVYDLPEPDRAAFDGKRYRTYNGPAGGLMVNFWSTRFTITALDERVHIDAFPGPHQLAIVNAIEHSDAPCTPARRHIGYRVERGETSIRVRFHGTLSRRCSPVVMTRSVIPVERYAQYVIPALWREAGGRLRGRVRSGPVPDHALSVHAHASRTAAEVVRATNKFSNNMMARHLLLTLGAHTRERGIRVEDGIAVLNQWLRQRGIDTPGLNIDNGSGLSRDTRISARGLAGVLRAGYRSRYAAELQASLPLAGEDRALRKLDMRGLRGTARLKTGLIDDVRALAGYVTRPGGEPRVVVLLVNHPGAHRALGTRLQQALIRDLLGR